MNISEIRNDPKFQALPETEKAKVIESVLYKDNAFLTLPDEEKVKVLNSLVGEGRQVVPQQRLSDLIPDSEFRGEKPSEPSPSWLGQQVSQIGDSAGRLIGPGSPTYSLVKGAVIDPLVGANQLLANTGLFGEDIKKGANQAAKYTEYLSSEGRAKLGRDGFDVIELVGNVVSPANRLIPNVKAAGAFQTIANHAVAGSALSSIIPVIGEEYWNDKNVQIGLGGILSAAIPGTALTAGKFGQFVSGLPLTKSARESAIYKYFSNLTGEDKQQTINALREAGEIVSGSKPTAAEALADTSFGASIIREQERLARGTETSKRFTQRFQEQANARAKALEDVFGNAEDLAKAKEARLVETTPMRERALAEANFYGDTASKLEQALEQGQRQFGSLSSKNKADILKGQIQNIKANGYYPLSSYSILDRIDSILKTPGTRSNEMLVSALAGIRGKLVNLSDERGIINSVDLYNIRKEINTDIAAYMATKGGPSASFNAQATKVEKNLKGILDAEINKASGSNLWSDYLSKFAEHSRKIDQMEIGTELQNKLGVSLGDVEKAGAFVTAVNNAGGLIKRQTGLPRYTKLEDVLTAPQMSAVTKVTADLNRKAKAAELGKSVETQVGPEAATEVRIPGVLERSIFVAREILNTLQRGSKSEFDKKVTELLLDPNKLADFLSQIPKSQTEQITGAMLAKMSPNVREQFISAYQVAPNVVSGQQLQRGLAVSITEEGS